ncbi:reverse transcriptase domain-containing protein [Tanacetum coccineum]
MSGSTILYESLAESLADSLESSVSSVVLPYAAPVVDSEPEPLEEPESPLTADYYGGLEFSKDDPLEDDSTDIASGASCAYPIQDSLPRDMYSLDVEEVSSTPTSSTTTYSCTPRSSSPSSIGPPPKRCRVSPNPASPPAASAPVLPAIPVEMLPPRKRFIVSERIKTLKREVVTLTARLAAVEIHIYALQRDVIGRDVRETGIMPVTRQGMTPNAIEELVAQRVVDALATYKANRNADNENKSGNGNRSGIGNSSGSQSDGESGLARWFEKMKSVFNINNYVVECQVKYAACTLLNGALPWWNFHVRTIRIEAVNEMSWKEMMRLMTSAYYMRNKIQKLEGELWNLTVKGIDVVGYTQRFQELALLLFEIVI